MTTIEDQLSDLVTNPPTDLERDTVVNAGAGDLVTTIDSRFGPLWIAWSRLGITGLTPLFASPTWDTFLEHHRRVSYSAASLPTDLQSDVSNALESGTPDGLTFDLRGLSGFQRSVLESCGTIPVGAVRAYSWIANELDKPGATRAVGTALAKNPIPLLIPCHRVVRSDGSIGSYAFGPEMKRELLIREGAIAL